MIRFVDICFAVEAVPSQVSLFENHEYRHFPDSTCYLVLGETKNWLEILSGDRILYLDKMHDGDKYVRV